MISDMCDLSKAILKRNPDYVVLRVGRKYTSSNTANELLHKLLVFKSFVTSNNKNCKVIIATLTMRVGDQKCGSAVSEVYEFLKKLNIPIVNTKHITRKHLGNKSLHSNTYGVVRLAMNFTATIRKFW